MSFTNFECFQAVTAYIFLLLIISAFVKLILRGDDNDKTLQKIIGGFAVFVVAIISRSAWVFSVSLFIGGLIIASEEFMQKLAIIFRSKSEDIGNNLKTGPATQGEIDRKQKEENRELSSRSAESREERQKRFVEERNRIKIAEKEVLKLLKKEYGDCFQKELRIDNNHGTLITDGVIFDDLESRDISKIVEIKYIRKRKSNMHLDFYVRRIFERVRFLFLEIPVLVILVSEEVGEKQVKKEMLRLEEKYKDTEFQFFNLKSEGGIELIYKRNQKKLF